MLDNLFQYTFHGEGAHVVLNPQHSIFEGHFPERAVLPGVCQVWIVRRIASQMAGRELRCQSVKEVKFLSPILPQEVQELDVRVKLTPQDAGVQVQASLWVGEQTMMKIRATYI